MKNTISIALILVISILLFGAAPAGAADEAAMKAFAETTINELTTAIETDNYDLYSKKWSPTGKAQLSKEKFAQLVQVVKSFGKVKSKTFFNTFKTQGYTVYQWKANFEKTPAPLYLRLVLKETGGKIMVEGHFILRAPK